MDANPKRKRPNRDPVKSREAQKRYAEKHPERTRDAMRRYRYGTDGKDTWTGQCHICATPMGQYDRHTHLDHDHATGKARGWLCKGCNNGIGLFSENPQRLEDAAAYLRRYK